MKSKRSTEGDPQSIAWRSAEALRIRQIVGGLLDDDPDTLALVLGDFNANPGDPAMRLLLDAPTSPPLRDLHAGLPAERRITYPSTRYPNTIFDYLLATPALARRVVDGSARILTDPDVTGGSDHRPVHATFVID